MTLELTNTIGGRKEPFEPLEPGRARMYHCGPTVKEPLTIGKFRSFLLADVLRRHLERSGYAVRQVMNITDVGHLNEFEEDIVEIAAARTGLYAWELAAKEEELFHSERRTLHILDADEYPRAREHIECMIESIRALEKTGLCYRAGGNLYLDVAKTRRFGELAGKSLEELSALQRSRRKPPHPEKRHPLDIDLWRTDAVHQMAWDSPWGRGFPGWHVECAAMSRHYLGDSFDIHTGTDENIFPHHECEIAQAETLSGKPMARYWLHTAAVTAGRKPMSPQNRNVITVRELLEGGIRGSVIRAALLSEHYRTPLDFSEAVLDRVRPLVNAILSFREYLIESGASPHSSSSKPAGWIAATEEAFTASLDDDLDFRGALRAVAQATQELEPAAVGDPGAALGALEGWNRVLGLF
jgi:cysteinyl-tRNA synthetase